MAGAACCRSLLREAGLLLPHQPPYWRGSLQAGLSISGCLGRSQEARLGLLEKLQEVCQR